MTALQWIRHPLDGTFTKELRRGIRTHRREKGRAGHRFSYLDLRTVWGADDDHAIVTHLDDRSWQYWWRHPERGWFLQSWHRLLNEAKDEAEKPKVFDTAPKTLFPGTYVVAEWNEPYKSNRPLMVRCQSAYTASEIQEVFENLGCTTGTKAVV